jgi:hypothetical protein
MYLQADTRERVMRRGTSSFEATTRTRKWNLVNTLLEQVNKKKKAIGERSREQIGQSRMSQTR